MPGDTGDQNGNDNRKPASRAAPAGRRVNRRRLRPDPRPRGRCAFGAAAGESAAFGAQNGRRCRRGGVVTTAGVPFYAVRLLEMPAGIE